MERPLIFNSPIARQLPASLIENRLMRGRWSVISLNFLPKKYVKKGFTDQTMANNSCTMVEYLASVLLSVLEA